jgi:hypothetical protein
MTTMAQVRRKARKECELKDNFNRKMSTNGNNGEIRMTAR